MQIQEETIEEFKKITGRIIADDQRFHADEEDYDSEKAFDVRIEDDLLSIEHAVLRMKDMPVLKKFAMVHGLYMEKKDWRLFFRKL